MEKYRIGGLTIEEHLLRLAEHGNQPFAASLNPGVKNVLGVRIPALRKLAVCIARGNWEAYLSSAGGHYMEERMLHGMVLGCIRPDEDVEVYLQRVSRFVRDINSWSVCDTFKFGGGRRFIDENRERLWQYLAGWMRADGEYEVRFGVVMLMECFMDGEHIGALLQAYDSVRHEGYYVRMAVAWALSVCFVKFPGPTLAYLRGRNSLDKFTYNKALQKIVESYRVDSATKEMIKGLRRK